MAKRAKVIVEKTDLDEDELIYAGEYIFRAWNARQQANATNRSLRVNRLTRETIPQMGSFQLETVIECLESAPFDIKNEQQKRKKIEEIPGWIFSRLYEACDRINGQLSSADRKN